MITAKQVLTDALGHLRGSWTQHSELRIDVFDGDYFGFSDWHEEDFDTDLDTYTPNGLKRFIEDPEKARFDTAEMCSVGGIFIARALLNEEDVVQINADLVTQEAMIILAQEINPEYLAPEVIDPKAYGEVKDIIVTWNDRMSRTEEEVVAMFEQAIASAGRGQRVWATTLK